MPLKVSHVWPKKAQFLASGVDRRQGDTLPHGVRQGVDRSKRRRQLDVILTKIQNLSTDVESRHQLIGLRACDAETRQRVAVQAGSVERGPVQPGCCRLRHGQTATERMAGKVDIVAEGSLGSTCDIDRLLVLIRRQALVLCKVRVPILAAFDRARGLGAPVGDDDVTGNGVAVDGGIIAAVDVLEQIRIEACGPELIRIEAIEVGNLQIADIGIHIVRP